MLTRHVQPWTYISGISFFSVLSSLHARLVPVTPQFNLTLRFLLCSRTVYLLHPV